MMKAFISVSGCPGCGGGLLVTGKNGDMLICPRQSCEWYMRPVRRPALELEEL